MHFLTKVCGLVQTSGCRCQFKKIIFFENLYGSICIRLCLKISRIGRYWIHSVLSYKECLELTFYIDLYTWFLWQNNVDFAKKGCCKVRLGFNLGKFFEVLFRKVERNKVNQEVKRNWWHILEAIRPIPCKKLAVTLLSPTMFDLKLGWLCYT